MTTLKELKIGDEITLVYRGIRRSSYSTQTWIDERQLGSTSFLTVTKIGTKYVHGVHIYFEDGQKKNAYYEDRQSIEDYIILKGIRTDLQDKHRQFLRDVDEHEKKRADYKREREWHYQKLLNTDTDEWDKQNPRPQPMKL